MPRTKLSAGVESKFAREQLAKHGWQEGAGLGKDETGIKEAIKVNIKNDKTGVGHDPGQDYSFHWWDHFYNKTATSIKVEQDDEGVKVTKAADSDNITTSKPSIAAHKNRELLYGTFVKAATLTNEGGSSKEVKEYSSEEEDEEVKLDKSRVLTDEEIFKVCGGRTAHKGARHGLKMNGKLQRLEEHDSVMTERIKIKKSNSEVNSMIVRDDSDKASEVVNTEVVKTKKKKKKLKNKEEQRDAKSLISLNENVASSISEESIEDNSLPRKKKKKSKKLVETEEAVENVEDNEMTNTGGDKSKKRKKKSKDIDKTEQEVVETKKRKINSNEKAKKKHGKKSKQR